MVEVAGVEPASEISTQPGRITTILPIYSFEAKGPARLKTSVTSEHWATLDFNRPSHFRLDPTRRLLLPGPDPDPVLLRFKPQRELERNARRWQLYF